jgi:hypothetical protein
MKYCSEISDMMVTVFWDVTPCSMVENFQWEGAPVDSLSAPVRILNFFCARLFHPKMEAAGLLVGKCLPDKTASHSIRYSYHRENFRSYMQMALCATLQIKQY